jgi:hypothetical protein
MELRVHECQRARGFRTGDVGGWAKPTLLSWLGVLLLVFGTTWAANCIVRQFRESAQGNTYYEFIGAGTLIAVVGVVVVVLARRRSRQASAEPTASADGGRDPGSS